MDKNTPEDRDQSPGAEESALKGEHSNDISNGDAGEFSLDTSKPEESENKSGSERVVPADQSDPKSGWVNESEHDHEDRSVKSEDQNEGRDTAVESRHPTGDPEATGGWWGDEQFSPIESLDDDITQPVKVAADHEAETRVTPVEGGADPDAVTRVTPVEDEPGSQSDAQTRPVPTGVDPNSATQVLSADQKALPDTDNMPTIPPPHRPAGWTPEKTNLPKHVSEVDNQATRVTPSAYRGSPHQKQTTQPSTANSSRPAVPSPTPGRRPSEMTRPQKTDPKKTRRKRLLRVFLAFVFLIVLIALIIGSIGIYQYFRIASTLPDVSELRDRAAQFETTRILDRDGNVLYEILDPNAGRRTYVALDDISPYLIAATIATEDKDFFTHPGFDMFAMTRALWQNYTAGEIRSGASTITQQLARSLLLDPSERYDQSYQRKAREVVLAYQITQEYSKEEILELYLNENFYGNYAYGVQAAAETYFRSSAEALNLWQSSFLAGLPQAPSVYDIYNNRDATLYRQRSVLVLMYELSRERNCIDISGERPPVCVSYAEATQAGIDLADYDFPAQVFGMRYPHWVVYIRTLLEAQFDAQTIYRSGFTVHTTLDPILQDEAERIVANQVAALVENNAFNGALVALDPNTGEILAMVGSADFQNDAIDGQVNMAVSQTRQPGSAIKPLTYVAAFEKGWTPSTLIWDVRSEFPPSADPFDTNPPYVPVNYDRRYHGPVTVRSALANSYNIPAVKTLEFVGIYDNPATPFEDGLIAFARRLGITSLNREDYGLSLTLGGGEVSLLELTSAFGTFANEGRRMPTTAISKIVDHTGNTIFEYEPPSGDQVVRVEHAYLISSILSDTNARVPMFGTNPVINLAFPAAVKTGTTNDFRDNWTVGYTPDLVVGVWVGNADYTPMVNTTGLTGAGPIWAQFMTYGINTLRGGTPSPFLRPPGVVDRVICSVSGTEPSEWCPQQRSEVFAADQPPLPKSEDLWKKVIIDTWTGLKVSDACGDYNDELFVMNVEDPWAQHWLKDEPEGRAWANNMGFSSPLFFVPERACRADDPRPIINLTGLSDGQSITTSPLIIRGMVTATQNFEYYRIEWGEGAKPSSWEVLVEEERSPQTIPGVLYEWDLESVEPGIITLKIYLHSTEDTYAEKLVTINLQVPTATPTETPEPTQTPTVTPTSEPAATQTPTMTPTPTPTPTPTE